MDDREVGSSYDSYFSGMNAPSTVLQLRLDTRELIESIEMFLKGQKMVFKQDSAGEVRSSSESIGNPKANEVGIQSLLYMIQSIINPHVVQGNFDNQRLDEYLIRFHVSLSKNIMVNLYEWDIAEDDYDVIVDTILSMVEPFITRLLDNEERLSYAPTMRYSESGRPEGQEEQQGLKLFKF